MAALAIPLVAGLAATAVLPAGFAALGMSAFGWGWALGSMAASYLLAPDSEGPRLSDLAAGGSSYGVPIPLCYGTTKIGGNVVWASDLIEASHTESAKGGPEYTSYSYSQHIAVMVCAGPVTGIRKIWANGRLILDASANNTGATGQSSNIRVYVGNETQVADSLLESHIGTGLVPAHRGYCYVVFENLQLEDYGNRAPNFEFEVVAAGEWTRPPYDALFVEELFMWSGSAFYDPYTNLIHYQDSWQLVNIFDVTRREWVGSYNLPVQTWQIWHGPGNIVYGMGQYSMYKMDYETGGTLRSWSGATNTIGAYRPHNRTLIMVEDNYIYQLSDNSSTVDKIATFPGVYAWQSLVIAGDYVAVYSPYSKRIGVLDGANNIVLDYSTGTPTGSYTLDDSGTYDSARNRVHFVADDQYTIWTINLDDMSVTSTYIAGSGAMRFPTYMPSLDNVVCRGSVATIHDPDTLQVLDAFASTARRIYEYPPAPDKGLTHGDGSTYYYAGFVALHKRITAQQVALSSIVADLCERAGLEAADYDVSGLTDMVDGYKTT